MSSDHINVPCWFISRYPRCWHISVGSLRSFSTMRSWCFSAFVFSQAGYFFLSRCLSVAAHGGSNKALFSTVRANTVSPVSFPDKAKRFTQEECAVTRRQRKVFSLQTDKREKTNKLTVDILHSTDVKCPSVGSPDFVSPKKKKKSKNPHVECSADGIQTVEDWFQSLYHLTVMWTSDVKVDVFLLLGSKRGLVMAKRKKRSKASFPEDRRWPCRW